MSIDPARLASEAGIGPKELEIERLQMEAVRLKDALRVGVWTEEERDGMAAAYKRAHEKHGFYETLFAVSAFILRHRASRL